MKYLAICLLAVCSLPLLAQDAEAGRFRGRVVQRTVVRQRVQRVRFVTPIVRQRVIVSRAVAAPFVIQRFGSCGASPVVVEQRVSGGCGEFFAY